VRATAEARTYFGFDPEGDFVLAGRIKGGVIGGADIAELPPDRLFFAGGGGSVRGYGYRSIGVDGPGDTVTGGRYLLEGSVEARAKVTDTIGIVGFVDAGYVAGDELVPLEEVRLGAGLGVRYYTGLGPLRLDFAVPLNKRANDPDYALYVGIGQAF
jgi:translocation and assembly module TamA